MKAKNSLSPTLVVERALAIVDEQGLDALTIRKVADAFGVTPMALYWHFANKEALLAAVGDAVVETIRVPDPALPLGEYVREGLTNLVDAMRAHPSVAPLVAQQLMQSEAGRDLTEHFLDKLADAGFGVERSADLAHYAMQIALTLVSREPGAELEVRPDDRQAVLDAKLATLESLPADRYPRLRAAAQAMVSCENSDDYYANGIDVFVAGLTASATAPA